MFHIIEVIKGKPEVKIKGLIFAKCDIYDYFVCGAKTPEVFENYSGKDKTIRWDAYNQKYSIDDFFKQHEEISKRKGFSKVSSIEVKSEDNYARNNSKMGR